MVRFATELDVRALPNIATLFTKIAPWDLWQARVKSLQQLTGRNPLWEDYVSQRHELELTFVNVRRYHRATGRWPWPPRSASEYRLASFMAVVLQLHRSLGEAGKARLSGQIRSGLDLPAGLGPLAFEMKIISHLMLRGFDVAFNDLENGGGFDFLATRNGVEVEVECKHVSEDGGQQIPRRNMCELSTAVWPVLVRHLETRPIGRLLRVMLPGRLEANKHEHLAIASALNAALSDRGDFEGDICSISMAEFAIDGTIFSLKNRPSVTYEILEAFLRDKFAIENSNVILHWNPGRAAMIVHFESARPNQVLRRLFDRLRDDSKRQFTKTRPGVLCVKLADLSDEQLLNLSRLEQMGEITGIRRVISGLLHRRPHLHSVALMTDGIVSRREREAGVRSVQENGHVYHFPNHNHPRAEDPALAGIFATE